MDRGEVAASQKLYPKWVELANGLKNEWAAVPGNHDPRDQFTRHVRKDTDGAAVTSSGIVALDGAGRVAELSRMMAGIDTGMARGHAEELLAAAAQAKSA